MKILSTTLLLTLLTLSLSAQFQKGNKFINGYIGLSTERQTNSDGDLSDKYFNISVGPTVGFFIQDNLALGGGLSYSYTQREQVLFSSKSSSDAGSINFFARKYFTLTDNFAITLTGSVYGGFSGFENGTVENNGFNIGTNVAPGLVFLMNPNWSLDLSMGSFGYSFNRNTTTETSTNRIGLNLGSFGIGWTYYFKTK